MTQRLTAEEVVHLRGLTPHPEGGFYRETFRDASPQGGNGGDGGDIGDGGRGASTAIYYLLRSGEVSAWHRVHAAEVWHYYAGAPLELTLSPGRGQTTLHLGPDLAAGERPQAVVPAGIWQAAKTLGDWTLVGCTVAPAFEFSAFEMAPPGWEPEAEPP